MNDFDDEKRVIWVDTKTNTSEELTKTEFIHRLNTKLNPTRPTWNRILIVTATMLAMFLLGGILGIFHDWVMSLPQSLGIIIAAAFAILTIPPCVYILWHETK